MGLGFIHWEWEKERGNENGRNNFKHVQSRPSPIPWFKKRQKTVSSTYITRDMYTYTSF